MHRFVHSVTGIALLALAPGAVAQIRVVSWNTLDNPTTSAEDADLATIATALAADARNGIAVRPSLFLLQEQQIFASDATPDRIASTLNSVFGTTDYVADAIGTGRDRLAAVYDANALTLEDSALVPVGTRPGWRGRFSVNGYDDAEFYAYSVHFKADDNPSDFSRRLAEANTLRANADALPAGMPVIFAGDFNFQSGEAAYDRMVQSGGNAAIDPLQTPSWSGPGFASLHTQSTRTSTAGVGGAGGGVDDRFDLQFVTASLLDGGGLSYIGPTAGIAGSVHSYHAFGNDGTTYNQAINDNPVGRSQTPAVLDALHDLSDHLPVVADFQLPASMRVEASADTVAALVGADASIDLTVSNDAPVSAPLGADALDYFGFVSGAASTTLGGTAAAASPGDTQTIGLNTAAAGSSTLSVFVQNLSPQGRNPDANLSIAVDVLNPGDASLAGDADLDTVAITLPTAMRTFAADAASVEVFNRSGAASGPTADLVVADLTDLADSGGIGVDGIAAGDRVAADTSRAVGLAADAGAAGSVSGVLRIDFSDPDLIGALTERDRLVIEYTGTVLELGDYDGDLLLTAADIDTLNALLGNADAPGYADLDRDGALTDADRVELVEGVFDTFLGDGTLDGAVNLADFAILGQNFGASGTGWGRGDFTGDGLTNLGDFALLGQNFGRSRGDAALAAAVPEPGVGAGALALAGLSFGRSLRRRGRR